MNWFHFQNLKKQRIAEAAVDSLKQQMAELCRSETLSRARQQHDQDLTVKREQHNAALLGLQQQLDASAQALKEQVSTPLVEACWDFLSLTLWDAQRQCSQGRLKVPGTVLPRMYTHSFTLFPVATGAQQYKFAVKHPL